MKFLLKMIMISRWVWWWCWSGLWCSSWSTIESVEMMMMIVMLLLLVRPCPITTRRRFINTTEHIAESLILNHLMINMGRGRGRSCGSDWRREKIFDHVHMIYIWIVIIIFCAFIVAPWRFCYFSLDLCWFLTVLFLQCH